jgi:hypothetical protein
MEEMCAMKQAFANIEKELDMLSAMLHLDREEVKEPAEAEPTDMGDDESWQEEEETDPMEEQEEGKDKSALSGIFGGMKKKKPMLAVSISTKSPAKPKLFG